MQLKYLKGKETNVYMGDGGKRYNFSPIGDLPENFARHILKTRPNDFDVYVKEAIKEVEVIKEEKPEVTVEKFKCESCEYEATSNAGLSAHKRFKHKEK